MISYSNLAFSSQVTLEDSGNPLATVSAFGINDEECQVTTNHGLNAYQRWGSVPSAKSLV